jgi:hypothetical protein
MNSSCTGLFHPLPREYAYRTVVSQWIVPRLPIFMQTRVNSVVLDTRLAIGVSEPLPSNGCLLRLHHSGFQLPCLSIINIICSDLRNGVQQNMSKVYGRFILVVIHTVLMSCPALPFPSDRNDVKYSSWEVILSVEATFLRNVWGIRIKWPRSVDVFSMHEL